MAESAEFGRFDECRDYCEDFTPADLYEPCGSFCPDGFRGIFGLAGSKGGPLGDPSWNGQSDPFLCPIQRARILAQCPCPPHPRHVTRRTRTSPLAQSVGVWRHFAWTMKGGSMDDLKPDVTLLSSGSVRVDRPRWMPMKRAALWQLDYPKYTLKTPPGASSPEVEDYHEGYDQKIRPSEWQVYIDGVPQLEPDDTAALHPRSATTFQDNWLGNMSPNNKVFDHGSPEKTSLRGSLDDVRVYERALDSAEIKSIAQGCAESPFFVTKTFSQSNPMAGEENTLTLTMSLNVDYSSSDGVIVLSDLVGFDPCNAQLDLEGSDGALFCVAGVSGKGSFSSSTNRLTLALCDGEQLVAHTMYAVSFSFQNVLSTATGDLISSSVQQYSPNILIELAGPKPAPPLPVSKSTGDAAGVNGGAEPLLVVGAAPSFSFVEMKQSTPMPSGLNLLQLSFRLNVDIGAGSLNSASAPPDQLGMPFALVLSGLTGTDRVLGATETQLTSPGAKDLMRGHLKLDDTAGGLESPTCGTFGVENERCAEGWNVGSVVETVELRAHGTIVVWLNPQKRVVGNQLHKLGLLIENPAESQASPNITLAIVGRSFRIEAHVPKPEDVYVQPLFIVEPNDFFSSARLSQSNPWAARNSSWNFELVPGHGMPGPGLPFDSVVFDGGEIAKCRSRRLDEAFGEGSSEVIDAAFAGEYQAANALVGGGGRAVYINAAKKKIIKFDKAEGSNLDPDAESDRIWKMGGLLGPKSQYLFTGHRAYFTTDGPSHPSTATWRETCNRDGAQWSDLDVPLRRNSPRIEIQGFPALLEDFVGIYKPEERFFPARNYGQIWRAGDTIEDSGQARVKFNGPTAAVTLGRGEAFVVDSASHAIWLRSESGDNAYIVNVYLGGLAVQPGDVDGFGLSTRFNSPTGMAAIGGDRYLITDTGNHKIKLLERSTSRVTTVAGRTVAGGGNADGVGSGLGGALLRLPKHITVAGTGEWALFVDQDGKLVKRFDVGTGRVTTIAGCANCTEPTSFSSTVAAANATFGFISSVTISPNMREAYLADRDLNLILKLEFGSRAVTSFAGTGESPGSTQDGIGTNAALYQPSGISLSSDGQWMHIVQSATTTALECDRARWGACCDVPRCNPPNKFVSVPDNVGVLRILDMANRNVQTIQTKPVMVAANSISMQGPDRAMLITDRYRVLRSAVSGDMMIGGCSYHQPCELALKAEPGSLNLPFCSFDEDRLPNENQRRRSAPAFSDGYAGRDRENEDRTQHRCSETLRSPTITPTEVPNSNGLYEGFVTVRFSGE
eukprot:1171177-Rhodomonas_salina.1